MNLLRQSIAVLNTAMNAVAGELIVARRKGFDSLDQLPAVLLATRHDTYGDEEYHFSSREQDWLIWAAEYRFGGQVTDPLENDEFDWIDPHGVKRTFQVLVRPDNRVFRQDQTRQQFRVYTIETTPNTESP